MQRKDGRSCGIERERIETAATIGAQLEGGPTELPQGVGREAPGSDALVAEGTPVLLGRLLTLQANDGGLEEGASCQVARNAFSFYILSS